MKTVYLIRWRCPHCLHTEQQPPRVRQAQHWCKNKRRWIELLRQDDDD